MKNKLLLLLLALGAGCHAVPRRKPAAAIPPTVARIATDPSNAKLAAARKFIGALMEQNDVLREQAKLAESKPAPAPEISTPVAVAESKPAPVFPDLPLALPNAEGLIDLAALAHPSDVPVNPFTLRANASDPKKEVSFLVQGLCDGPNAAALINDRMLLVGDAVESFTLERIDPDAVTLRNQSHRIRLTAGEKPVRVRLP